MPLSHAPARLSLCLSLYAAGFGCDDSTPPLTPGGENLSQASGQVPSKGDMDVKIIVNHSPQVFSMGSSDGRVETGVPVNLRVNAEDPDGDSLKYEWTSTCPGTFARADVEFVTFTPSVLDGFTACSVEVDVSDGHGGAGKGILVLTTVQPTINVAPTMGVAYQSGDVVAAGELVILHATATDPEGEALTWKWTAEGGTFLGQVDDVQSSDVHWTAPPTPGATYRIVATASDPEGGSATFTFVVAVRN